jgi:phosphopantetheine adenylyltransferase
MFGISGCRSCTNFQTEFQLKTINSALLETIGLSD